MSADLAAPLLAALATGVLRGCLLVAAAEASLWLARSPTAATRYLVRWTTLMAAAAVSLGPALALLRPVGAGSDASLAAAPEPWALPAPVGAWPAWVIVAMATLAAVRVARLVAGLARVRRWKRGASPLRAPGGLTAGRGEPRRSATLPAPVAVGYLRPAILLPDRLLRELDDAELRQVLEHERAHLARLDDWTALAQRCVEALLPWHPAVVWLGRRLELDRELACDDRVVARLGGGRAYARSLVRLAAAAPPQDALAAGVSPSRGHLAARVQALVGPRPARTGVSLPWGAWGMAALAAAVAMVPAAVPGFTIAPSFFAAPHLTTAIRVVGPSAPTAADAPSPATVVDAGPALPTPEPDMPPAREPRLAVACGAACVPSAAPVLDHAAAPRPAPARVAWRPGEQREPVISGRAGEFARPALRLGAPRPSAVGAAAMRPPVGHFRRW